MPLSDAPDRAAAFGLLAPLLAVVGAALGANLILLALDIAWARQERDRFANPKETLEARPSTGVEHVVEQSAFEGSLCAKGIRKELGGRPVLRDPVPDRPKGMHRATYERLRQELLGVDRAEE